MSVFEQPRDVRLVKNQAREQLALAILFSCVIFGLAFIYGGALYTTEGLYTGTVSAFSVPFMLFLAEDRFMALVFIAVLSAAVLVFVLWPKTAGASAPAAPIWERLPVAVLTAAAFLLAWAATVFAHHSFDMSIDEFVSAFQAKIFLKGQLLAELPPDQFANSHELQPFYLYHDAAHHLWASGYRPVFAAFRALFALFNAEHLVNPAFAAVSVWAIFDISKRTFPDVKEAPALAALMLLLSPQFLYTAASGFAFGAHLGLNLLWLALFLRGSFRDHCLAAAAGFLATGLHQVSFHPLFAAPFLAALLFGQFGSRKSLIPYAVAYSLALPVFVAWFEISVWLQTGDASVLPRRLSDLAYFKDYVGYISENADSIIDRAGAHTLVNIFRFSLWLSPAVLPLSIVAFVNIRKLALVPVLCGVSVLLSVIAAHILMPNQMHSWGSRYYHPVLGCMIIFATAGYAALKPEMETAAFRAAMGFVLVVSAIVLLPWRGIQVDEKVGPRAQVQRAIEATDADYVIIANNLWFGNDYIRNDPFLRNRPLIANAAMLEKEALLLGKKVIVIDRSDLIRMGLPSGTMLEPAR